MQRTFAVLSLMVVVALATLVGLSASDNATVRSRHDLDSVSFGRPIDWFNQDRTSSDPPFPIELGPLLPQEVPTSISVGPFLLNVAGLVAIQLAIYVRLAKLALRTRMPVRQAADVAQ